MLLFAATVISGVEVRLVESDLCPNEARTLGSVSLQGPEHSGGASPNGAPNIEQILTSHVPE
ncbi:acyl-CoA synthetase (AMP-forming)/AMP-acid ligase II [Anopheles sinensis]|uniref:Acyl-CoA synthetase (AMP-forming)/AMP-acid ligase II n=1 Tax=Anopheles sinensis TaxID=74873 RepID=A0A084VZF8_ANOSI|nr:acyl-CoA synthetase (AMP-forming)/AMP-acid ligase II [Anopheles sinensis]